MSTDKKKCCQGCKKGQPGQNKSCQAKQMMEQLSSKLESSKKDSTNA